MAKGEIACFEQFLLLSQCFQNVCAAEASESFCMWERAKFYNKYESVNEKSVYFWTVEVQFSLNICYDLILIYSSWQKLLTSLNKTLYYVNNVDVDKIVDGQPDLDQNFTISTFPHGQAVAHVKSLIPHLTWSVC